MTDNKAELWVPDRPDDDGTAAFVQIDKDEFMECAACRAKDIHDLCRGCLSNRAFIEYRDRAWGELMTKYGVIIKKLTTANENLRAAQERLIEQHRGAVMTMGISARDWRAMMIFQAMLSTEQHQPPTLAELAADAYRYADALEAASKK